MATTQVTIFTVTRNAAGWINQKLNDTGTSGQGLARKMGKSKAYMSKIRNEGCSYQVLVSICRDAGWDVPSFEDVMATFVPDVYELEGGEFIMGQEVNMSFLQGFLPVPVCDKAILSHTVTGPKVLFLKDGKVLSHRNVSFPSN